MRLRPVLGPRPAPAADAGDAAAELMGATAVSVGHNSACACFQTEPRSAGGTTPTASSATARRPAQRRAGTVHGLTGVTAISIGGGADDITACALVSGGAVDCWGGNVDGALGTGTTTGPFNCSTVGTFAGWPCSTTPVAVAGLTGATAIAIGGSSVCALLSGGTVQCWGDNSSGQLGNGTTTSSASPVAVSGLTGRLPSRQAAIRPSRALSCRAARCSAGETTPTVNLATGPRQARRSPVTVAGLTGATAISLGGESACALLGAGAVQCWGGPSDAAPAAVSGLTGATAVSVGSGSACALLAGGTVECWGNSNVNNSDGQLGNGTTTSSATPVQVSDLTDATAISSGVTRPARCFLRAP